MGTNTVSGKGKHQKTGEDAVREVADEEEQQAIAQRQMALMERGLKMKKWKFNRAELYDRKY